MIYIFAFLIVLLSIYLLNANKRNVLFIILILLPFHAFIKAILSLISKSEAADIFAYWKELSILILFLRTSISINTKYPKNILIAFSLLVIIVIFYLMAFSNLSIGMPSLRNLLFPLLLYFAITNMEIDKYDYRIIINIIIFTSVLSSIFGIIQYFWLNIPISFIMGYIDSIGTNGYINYTTSSFRIMGLERMSGISGGPNILGVLKAFEISFLFGHLVLGGFLNDKRKLIYVIAIILGIVNLVFSFSRAGWFICGMSILLILWNCPKKILFRTVLVSLLVSICLITLVFTKFDYVVKIFSDSISGKEASIDDRLDNIFNSMQIIIKEPFGHGLGMTDFRYNKNIYFYTESTIANLSYEIGILGAGLYLVLIFMVLIRVFNFSVKNKSGIIIYSICIASFIVAFISVNPFDMPYVYYWWFLMALGNSKYIFKLYAGFNNRSKICLKYY